MQQRRILLLSAGVSALVSTLVVVTFFVATSRTLQYSVQSVPDAPIVRAPTDHTSSITQAVERAAPAVVSVIVRQDVPILEEYFNDSPFPFFDPFSFGRRRKLGTEKREVGGGTAFFVSSDGLLMTNKHVVQDASAEYTVLLNDGKKLEANVVARDPSSDIALLQVKGSHFPALQLSPKETLHLGQAVIAIGNALGEFRNTVSVGVIAGLSRSIEANSGFGSTERLSRIIQTDAAINPGNSGGPLLNSDGQVIGMNTAIVAQAQNIGFAIPAADLQNVLESFKKHGRIVRPYLGIRYAPVTKEIQEKLQLPFDYGVILASGENDDEPAVLPHSPADKAGLEKNDVILSVDSIKLTGDVSLVDLITRHTIGDAILLRVLHRGQEKDVSVQLEEWKPM